MFDRYLTGVRNAPYQRLEEVHRNLEEVHLTRSLMRTVPHHESNVHCTRSLTCTVPGT